MPGYAIRPATVGDAAIIARHRVAMFRDMGQVPTDALAAKLLDTSISALAALLQERAYIGWLALGGEDQVVAGAGVDIRPQLPRIALDGTRVVVAPVPLVLNVYTDPPWRNRGIARALMKTVMEWTAAEGFDRLLLHASDAARPLYVSLGFVPTNEMRWAPAADRGGRRARD